MTNFWDFRRLLGVYPESVTFTCVGFAPSKGRRCHNTIAEPTLSEAINILKEMQRMDLYHRGFMDQISSKLDHLAATTLCKRYHRDKPGYSQRFLKHNEWMEIVSDWRNDVLANVFHATQLVPSPSPVTPSPSPNVINAPQAVLYTPPITPSPSFNVLPIFNPPVPTPNQFQEPPAVPQHQVAVPFGLLGLHLDNATAQPQTIHQQQTEESSQSPPSSGASAAGSNSFHDSGYSTAPSSTTSDSELPLNEPARLFPSPPSSIWSMDPPSLSPSSPSSEASSPSMTGTQTPTSSNFPSRSSRRSRNSSAPQAPSPSTTLSNALAAALATALTAEPSPPSVSSSSTAGSSNNSSTRRPSRSQSPSVITTNPLTTSIATALATVLTEHIITALTQDLAQSDGLAALAPLLQSLLGIQDPSRRSSKTSSHRSSRSSTSNNPHAPPNHSPNQPAPLTPSTPSPQPAASTSTTPPVIRRPLADPCYVCILPIDGPDDAVWCRASCGENLHTECFEMWAESELELGRDLICGCCRVAWI